MLSLFLLQPKKPSLTGGIFQSATLIGDSFFMISDAVSIKKLALSKPLFPESILLCPACIVRFQSCDNRFIVLQYLINLELLLKDRNV